MPNPNSRDVVIIWDENKNWNHWKLAVVTDLIRSKDGIMRGAKLNSLELHCAQMPLRSRLNPAAPEFHARPQRDATAAAAVCIQEIVEQPELPL